MCSMATPQVILNGDEGHAEDKSECVAESGRWTDYIVVYITCLEEDGASSTDAPHLHLALSTYLYLIPPSSTAVIALTLSVSSPGQQASEAQLRRRTTKIEWKRSTIVKWLEKAQLIRHSLNRLFWGRQADAQDRFLSLFVNHQSTPLITCGWHDGGMQEKNRGDCDRD